MQRETLIEAQSLTKRYDGFTAVDSIDFSVGYSGTIDNALIIHAPTEGNRCIEGYGVASTRLAGGGNQTPLTTPLRSSALSSTWWARTHITTAATSPCCARR